MNLSNQHAGRLSSYARCAAVAGLTPTAMLAGEASGDVHSATGLSIRLDMNTGTQTAVVTGDGGSVARTLSFIGSTGTNSYGVVMGDGVNWLGVVQQSRFTTWYGGLPVSEGASWNNHGRTTGEFSGTNVYFSYSASVGDINWGSTSGDGFNDDPMGVGSDGRTWYLLFKFTGTDAQAGNYGWLSFDAYATGNPADSYVIITGWGWDDSGSTIEAGTTAPSTVVPGIGGLAALAAGAGGVRQRRQRISGA